MMNRMRNVFKSKEGFTLIELMVVLAVLGILAAVAVPRFSDMTGKANLVKAKNELKQVQTALELYYAENNEYPKTDAKDAAFEVIIGEYLVSSDITSYEFTYDADGGTDGYSVTAVGGDVTVKITRDSIVKVES